MQDNALKPPPPQKREFSLAYIRQSHRDMVFLLSSSGSFNCPHPPYHLALFLRIIVVSRDFFCLDSPDPLICLSLRISKHTSGRYHSSPKLSAAKSSKIKDVLWSSFPYGKESGHVSTEQKPGSRKVNKGREHWRMMLFQQGCVVCLLRLLFTKCAINIYCV